MATPHLVGLNERGISVPLDGRAIPRSLLGHHFESMREIPRPPDRRLERVLAPGAPTITAVFLTEMSPEEVLAFYRSTMPETGRYLALPTDRHVIDYPRGGVDFHLFCGDEQGSSASWLQVRVVRERGGDTLTRLDLGEGPGPCNLSRSSFLPTVRITGTEVTARVASFASPGSGYALQTNKTPAEIVETIDRAFIDAGCRETGAIQGPTLTMKTWETDQQGQPITVECQAFRIPGEEDRVRLILRYYQPDGSPLTER